MAVVRQRDKLLRELVDALSLEMFKALSHPKKKWEVYGRGLELDGL